MGAGSAGCVLANRLSEDPKSSVLIIEAGGSEDDNFNMSIPIASGLLQKSKQDWKFLTVPQKNACMAMVEKVLFSCKAFWLTLCSLQQYQTVIMIVLVYVLIFIIITSMASIALKFR